MILKTLVFSDESTTDNDVLESVMVRLRGRERKYLLALVSKSTWDHLVSGAHELRMRLVFALNQIPSGGFVTFLAKEVVFLGLVTGNLNDHQVEEIAEDGVPDNRAVYDCVAFSVFSRIWEDGIDGARREIFG